MSATKDIRIRLVSFALDEKSCQGLVVFETLKEKTKFSLVLNSSVDLALFLQESFKRQESGFVLSKKILDGQGLKIKKGKILSLETEKEEAQIYVKHEEKKGSQKIKISLLEILGLWTLENFPLYADADFIEQCRDLKVDLKETANPLNVDLHKRYGQKYLM